MSIGAPLLVRSHITHRWVGRTDEQQAVWLSHRFPIYFGYTLASLKRQTDRDFTIWLNCCQGTQKEAQPYMKALEEAGVLATFDNGRKHLSELAKKHRYVYLLQMDSDDMLDPRAIATVKDLMGDHPALLFRDGFVYHLTTGHLHRTPHKSPPFFCLRVPILDNGVLEIKVSNLGHGNIIRFFECVFPPPGMFCMTSHARNIVGFQDRDEYPSDSTVYQDVMKRFRLNEHPAAFWKDHPAVLSIVEPYFSG